MHIVKVDKVKKPKLPKQECEADWCAVYRDINLVPISEETKERRQRTLEKKLFRSLNELQITQRYEMLNRTQFVLKKVKLSLVK